MKHNRLKATATKDKHQMEGTGVAITKKSPKTSGFKHTILEMTLCFTANR